MATTTNYGWTTPDDTALVKDGASAIRTLGTSVDATTKNLNPSTTLGDIEYRSSTANVNTRLPLGTAGQVLKVNSGATAPEWSSDNAGMTNPMTTTGDTIYSSSGSTPARLGIGSTGQVLTVAGGVPTWATPASGTTFSGVSLYKSANQSLTSGAGTNATFDTELFDTDAFHSTSSNTDRITIPTGKNGYYLLTGRANFAASATGIRIGMIRKNAGATQLARHTMKSVTAAADAVLTVNTVVNLVATDYVVFECYQDGTGSLNLQGGGEQYTTFSAVYLGA
jgi:hypothetical protein